MEIWKKIPNYSRYEVSNFGQLRSLNYKNSKKTKNLKPSITQGYYKTMLQNDEKKYCTISVHSIVCLAFLGEKKKGQEINHIDGNKTNNILKNLEYCTHSENIKHAFKLGLSERKVGSKNGMAKLTEKQVLEIREHAAKNGRYYGRKMLAEKYKVCECTIKEVVTRRRNKFYNV
jgi:hypothetical protein